ncbi:MAG: DUF3575 domain-containing protein [Chitinophagales bacterium]|nr:DUF3575 domain-containing protein [Chitinophagales bacterium]
MKRLLRIGLLFFWLIAFGVLVAQEDIDSSGFEGFKTARKLPERQNLIKFSPVPLFVGQIPICGEIRFTYERMIAHNHSLLLGGSYNYPNILLLMASLVTDSARTGFKSYSLRGGRVIFGYRFYPLRSKEAPEGLYVGPYFSYNMVKIKRRGGTDSYLMYNYLNVSIVTGYQLELRNGWYMDFMGGLGYRRNFSVFYDSRNDRFTKEEMDGIPVIKNIKLVLQVNVCYSF